MDTELVTVWDGTRRWGKDSDLLVPVNWADPRSPSLPREISAQDEAQREARRRRWVRRKTRKRFTAAEYAAMRARLES